MEIIILTQSKLCWPSYRQPERWEVSRHSGGRMLHHLLTRYLVMHDSTDQQAEHIHELLRLTIIGCGHLCKLHACPRLVDEAEMVSPFALHEADPAHSSGVALRLPME